MLQLIYTSIKFFKYYNSLYIQVTLQSVHIDGSKSQLFDVFNLVSAQMSNFQVPNYCDYYNPNGGKKICYLLMAGHADGIFVDGWLCWVQFRSHGSDIGHVIMIAVT